VKAKFAPDGKQASLARHLLYIVGREDDASLRIKSGPVDPRAANSLFPGALHHLRRTQGQIIHSEDSIVDGRDHADSERGAVFSRTNKSKSDSVFAGEFRNNVLNYCYVVFPCGHQAARIGKASSSCRAIHSAVGCSVDIPANRVARFVSLYWGGAMLGRSIGAAVLQRVRAGMVLAAAAIAACLLVLTSVVTTGHTAMWSILLVGLCNSIMFPSIFTLGVAGLGRLTGDASGVLVMAIVGGAIIPEIQGALADRIGIQHAFILPAVCYLYILYYALKGSQSAVSAGS